MIMKWQRLNAMAISWLKTNRVRCSEIERQLPIAFNYWSITKTLQGMIQPRIVPLTCAVSTAICHFPSRSSRVDHVMELSMALSRETRESIGASLNENRIDPRLGNDQPTKLTQESFPLLNRVIDQSTVQWLNQNAQDLFDEIRIDPVIGEDQPKVMKAKLAKKSSRFLDQVTGESSNKTLDSPFYQVKVDPDWAKDRSQAVRKKPSNRCISPDENPLSIINETSWGKIRIDPGEIINRPKTSPEIVQRPVVEKDPLTRLVDSQFFVRITLLILITITIVGSCVGIAVIQKRINWLSSMLHCPSYDTPNTTSTSTTTTMLSSTTMVTSTWPMLQPFIKEKSNFEQRNVHRSNNAPYLSLCPEEEKLSGDDITDDPFIGHIAEDRIGYHYVPGCRYYFVLNKSRTYDGAQQYCKEYGAFLAVIEDSLEECRIGQKLRSIQQDPTRLWMSGIVMPSTTGLHSSDLLWNDGVLMTSLNDIHICWNLSATRMNRFALDYQTYEPQSQQYGCWNAFDPQSTFDFLCKKCLVWEWTLDK